MKNIISKPHLFFFGLIPIILIVGYIYKDESIDINISYAYYLISYKQLSYFFAVFFGLIGLNYFSLYWAKRPTKKGLTIVHMVLQCLSLLLFFTKNNWNWLDQEVYPEGINISADYSNLVLIIAFFIFLISAFVHLINFFISLLIKSKLPE